jgi:hypothetical protein
LGYRGGNLGNKVTNTFPHFFSKLNRTSGHVNMPGGCALSAHRAGKLIVKTDRQTETKKDTYAKFIIPCDTKGAVIYFESCVLMDWEIRHLPTIFITGNT